MKGLTIFKITHTGRRNIIMTLLDGEGKAIDLLVNRVGNFNGSTAVGLQRAGEYVINVEADGAWTVEVNQPRSPAAEGPPQSFTGESQAVSPFFRLGGGMATFRLKHEGQRNFIVALLDADGQVVDLLVNKVGVFEGSKAVGGRRGIHLLRVDADGQWSVAIE